MGSEANGAYAGHPIYIDLQEVDGRWAVSYVIWKRGGEGPLDPAPETRLANQTFGSAQAARLAALTEAIAIIDTLRLSHIPPPPTDEDSYYGEL